MVQKEPTLSTRTPQVIAATTLIDVDVDAVTANPPSERSHMFRPQNWLDRVFEIGIIGKASTALSRSSAACCCSS
jgi:hypothetical protein